MSRRPRLSRGTPSSIRPPGRTGPGGRVSVQDKLDQYGDRIMEALTGGEQTLRSIAHYELLVELGEGAMGTVFLAHHVSEGGIRKEVAIKVLKEKQDAKTIRRFIEEAELLAQLSQGTIVELLALESMEIALPDRHKIRSAEPRQTPKKKLYFMVLEYVNGPGLDHIVRSLREHRFLMHPAIVGFILNKSVIALDEAHNLTDDDGHSLNLVHRDISPSNILFFRRAGITKLADFGVAKALDPLGERHDNQPKIVGKPRYMAPEQLEGRATSASDMWALGVIGYECLTGFSPYRLFGNGLREQIKNLQAQFTHELRAPKDILMPPAELGHFNLAEISDILMLCLSQVQGQRPTAAELNHLLESRFLYAAGLGPTNKTLAAWLNLLDGMNAEQPTELPDGFAGSDEAATLKKTLWLESPLDCFPRRLTKAYQPDFVRALKAKEANPCLLPLPLNDTPFEIEEYI